MEANTCFVVSPHLFGDLIGATSIRKTIIMIDCYVYHFCVLLTIDQLVSKIVDFTKCLRCHLDSRGCVVYLTECKDKSIFTRAFPDVWEGLITTFVSIEVNWDILTTTIRTHAVIAMERELLKEPFTDDDAVLSVGRIRDRDDVSIDPIRITRHVHDGGGTCNDFICSDHASRTKAFHYLIIKDQSISEILMVGDVGRYLKNVDNFLCTLNRFIQREETWVILSTAYMSRQVLTNHFEYMGVYWEMDVERILSVPELTPCEDTALLTVHRSRCLTDMGGTHCDT